MTGNGGGEPTPLRLALALKLRFCSNIAHLQFNDNDFHYRLSLCDFRLRAPLNLAMFEAIGFIHGFQELT
ncbi:hypothetical protein [Serratia marcescens]|jgi:hypothetical protein|uniref:hypothetical protein n=1 Tax=Serratia marcescens TaxID=615 RepID=UPI001F404010|nr:hypothetical protein [Serratia marcescens]